MCFVKKWESMTQASKELGINQADISKCCAGKRNQCGNYIWLNDDGLLNLLEKKDKIIDLMVEEFKKIFSEGEPCDLDHEMECKKYKECKDCIKQYFERKVENGN